MTPVLWVYNQNTKKMKLSTTHFFTLLFSLLFTSGLLAQKEYSHEETYPISAKGTLSISTEDADITIKGADRNDVYVKVWRSVKGKQWTNKDFGLEYTADGKDVSIVEDYSQNNNNLTFSFYSSIEYTIYVEVPHTVLLKMEGDDDNYYIENMANSVSIDAEDGDVVLKSIHGENMDINLDDGDVFMNDVSGNLKLVLEDGDTEIKNGKLNQIKMRMDDGSLDMVNTEKIKELEIKAYDGDVDIKCDLVDEADVNVNLEDGDLVLRIVDGGGEIEVDHEDGEVSYREGIYELVENGSYSKSLVTTQNGNSKIRISVEDGDVELK